MRKQKQIHNEQIHIRFGLSGPISGNGLSLAYLGSRGNWFFSGPFHFFTKPFSTNIIDNFLRKQWDLEC
jgi:hypothetical protein